MVLVLYHLLQASDRFVLTEVVEENHRMHRSMVRQPMELFNAPVAQLDRAASF